MAVPFKKFCDINRKCMITVLCVIYTMFFIYQMGTTMYKTVGKLRTISVLEFNATFNPKDISCYILPENDLQLANKDFKPSKKSIFFLETSCKGGLNSRQACAVESAARAHPKRDVKVLVTGPLNDKFKEGDVYIKLTTELNVEFARIYVTDFTRGTPFEELILKERLKDSDYPVSHSSDVLRFLTLYKYGGLYLDLDVVVMKSFDTLPSNFVAKERVNVLAAGILELSSDRVGKNFSETAVRDLAVSFNPKSWGHNGPALIQRTLQKICSVTNVENMNEHTCKGIHVLEPQLFYPIYYPSWNLYFQDRQLEPTNAYTHHIWNALAYKTGVPKNSFYARLAQRYCPTIYDLFGDHFGF